MWRWHAIEEIEHKAVAYDTWVHATRALPRWRRWAMRSLAMAAASLRFHGVVFRNTADLLAQDGRNDWRSWRGLLAYLYGGPGAMRSEEHTSELQSLMRLSYAVFCLKKKKQEAYAA